MKKKPKIKAKLLKRLPQKMGDDAYAYTAALLEDVNSNFRVFAENLTIVRDKVDAHHVELGRMNESFTELKIGQNLLIEDVAVLKEDVSSMKQNISSLNERQAVMEADIKEIRLEIKSIKNEMADLRNLLYQKADIDRLQSLEKRVSRIEETIQSRL